MKRLFDLTVSLLLLLCLSPILLAIAVILRCTIGSPVLFAQDRPGLAGKVFRMVKFRTMNSARNSAGELLSDRERTTRFGGFLRRSSLDELPELFNVVLGHMSLVGPRPLLVAYLEHYSPEQQRRHDVRPGITGWAQVNGRNGLNWEEKLALDIWYVDHRTFRLDLFILWATLRTVWSCRGTAVNADCVPAALKGAKLDQLLSSPNSLAGMKGPRHE